MSLSRRRFLKLAGVAGTAAVTGVQPAEAFDRDSGDTPAVLVDTTRCVGCRACEAACSERNELPEPALAGQPAVFDRRRSTEVTSFTVVNRGDTAPSGDGRYVKTQCMHCLAPACASACPARALELTPEGPVVYHPERCLGCRYCMVACRFDMPKFEYGKPSPYVRKCHFCADRQAAGQLPACVASCPSGALQFGRRGELLDEAYRRIFQNPDKYVHSVYGEHEVGGTRWLYISDVPFDRLGLRAGVGTTPPTALTSTALGVVPLVLTLSPPLLLGIHAFSKRRDAVQETRDAPRTRAVVLHQTGRMSPRLLARRLLLMGMAPSKYLRSLLTPFNAVAALILLVGVPLILYRFSHGLAATTNLTQVNPWGLWIGLDVLSGVALAAGGFTVASAVYIFGLREYLPIVRPAILTGFLGYLFVVIGLVVDLGRPWKLPVPIGYSWGTGSVMFEVAWCVCLYAIVLALEFAPAALEWLGFRQLRERLIKLTIGLTVFGVVLSTLHQSSLGALFLLAPHRLHPLWYSSYIPVHFFVSAVVAGLSMVIVESSLSHRVFKNHGPSDGALDLDTLTLGLGRAASVVLFAYVFLRLIALADGGHWALLATPYGFWYLAEVIAFAVVPCALFAYGAHERRPGLLRAVAAWTVIGVVVNRLNVSVFAMNWAGEKYYPSWMEVATSLAIITIGVLTFGWVANRMPVLRPHPAYEPH